MLGVVLYLFWRVIDTWSQIQPLPFLSLFYEYIHLNLWIHYIKYVLFSKVRLRWYPSGCRALPILARHRHLAPNPVSGRHGVVYLPAMGHVSLS